MTNLEKFSILAIFIVLNYAFILGFVCAKYAETLLWQHIVLLWISSVLVFKTLVKISTYFIDINDFDNEA